jgi:hypothetical protein
MEVSNSISRDSPFADQGQQQQADSLKDPGKDAALLGGGLAPSCRAGSKRRMLHCSRTRWAVALVALVVVLGVAIGAGVGVATKKKTGVVSQGLWQSKALSNPQLGVSYLHKGFDRLIGTAM